MYTRRELLKNSAKLFALAHLPYKELSLSRVSKKFSISACDWSIGKDSNIEAFDVAKQIGLDGIMVNMGSEKNNLHLREPKLQQAYIETSQKTGVKIASLAIG